LTTALRSSASECPSPEVKNWRPILTNCLFAQALYEGYLNYIKRSHINGGLDLGYEVTPDVALTLGFRYGSQHQLPSTKAITSDYANSSSSSYQ
jgi:hypothetical protein